MESYNIDPLTGEILNFEIQKIKENIFKMGPKSFGITGEGIISNILLSKGIITEDSDNAYHDRKIDSKKIEIKCSRVKNNYNKKIDVKNLKKSIIEYESEDMVLLEKYNIYNFDCNIQQVKIEEFDILYYALFFDDYILLFKIDNNKIIEDKNIKYNDKQHKGNVGEGQFHIKKDTLDYHIKNYLYDKITYEQLYKIL